MNFRGFILLVILVFTSSMSGCSVYMASHQPDKKDVSLFKKGTPRSMLLGEFGYPTASTNHDGKKWDIWRFKQGYSDGAKTGRAVGHAAMDVLTLGIWEVAGTPIETAADGTEVAYEVAYDNDDNVSDVVLLSKSNGK